MNLSSLLDEIIAKSTKAGADHAVIIANKTVESNMRFAKNRIIQNAETENISLKVAVAIDEREATVETNCMEMECIDEMISRVIQFAKKAPVNPEFIPPVTPGEYPETQTWFDSTASVTRKTRTETVRMMCDYAHSKAVDLFGNLTVTDGQIAAANSSGLFVSQPYTEASIRCTARTRTGNGSGKSAFGEGDWRLLQPMNVAKKAVNTALLSRDPIKIKPGCYTVILSPEAALEYLVFLVFAMDARKSAQGQSFFSGKKRNQTRIGEQLFGSGVTIRSLFNHPKLPTLPFGLAFGSGGSNAGMLFSFGLPMQNHTWIQNGVLMNLRDSPYWAIKNGRKPMGYPFNIVMDGFDSSLEEIILGTDYGIYISSFWYTNPTDMNKLKLTGLTRDGTFLIEKGEVTHSLHNFRFNDSPVDSLNRLMAIGRMEKVDGEFISGLMPYLKIKSFYLSSVSDAV